MGNFNLLTQRAIIDILIGDTKFGYLDGHADIELSMPYLPGRRIIDISALFGLPQAEDGLSRWMYMNNLLVFAAKNDKTVTLLGYLFEKEHFDYLSQFGSPEEVSAAYEYVVNSAINKINVSLSLGGNELRLIDSQFILCPIGKEISVAAPQVLQINVPYILALRERCETDLLAARYDSVITKSRTLIEEVLIYILEQNGQTATSKGDVIKLYAQVKGLYGMSQNPSYDKRVNSLLSGHEKVIQAIAEMRNMNSDAHGVGTKRIDIKEREARLVVNSAITFSEYVLSVHTDAQIKKHT